MLEISFKYLLSITELHLSKYKKIQLHVSAKKKIFLPQNIREIFSIGEGVVSFGMASKRFCLISSIHFLCLLLPCFSLS